jgi:hypothetical protein
MMFVDSQLLELLTAEIGKGTVGMRTYLWSFAFPEVRERFL